MATNIRQNFELDLKQLTAFERDQTDLTALEEVKRKVKLNRMKNLKQKTSVGDYVGSSCEDKFRLSRRIFRRRLELTAADIVEIVSFWKVNKPTFRDLGHKFFITPNLAQRLVKQYEKDPSFLAKRRVKEQVKEEKLSALQGALDKMIKAKEDVWSIEQVRAIVLKESD
jgi:plasmid maintenance system antidote protein VapI